MYNTIYQKMKAQQVFSQEFSDFNLIVINKQDQLTVTINDFDDWTVYSNQYTEQDIRNKVDQKMCISDVFTAFQLTKNSEGKSGMAAELEFSTRWTCVSSDEDDDDDHVIESRYEMRKELQFTIFQHGRRFYNFQLILEKEGEMAECQISEIEKRKFRPIEIRSALNVTQINQMTQSFRNLIQANTNQFKLDYLKLRYVGSNKDWAQYIFYIPIASKEFSKFKLKISKLANNRMAIGVLEYHKRKNKRSSIGQENSICYTSNGRKYQQNNKKVKEGSGFKQGDVVWVEVCRSTNIVKYFVNGVHQATQEISQTMQSLVIQQRVLMPFVEMYHTGDTVEWLLNEMVNE